MIFYLMVKYALCYYSVRSGSEYPTTKPTITVTLYYQKHHKKILTPLTLAAVAKDQ